jgi:RNA chaperone Hfq
MVIPARRFRNNDIIVPDTNKTTSDKQDSVDSRSDISYKPNMQDKTFDVDDLAFETILKNICDNNLLGMVYLINGIKLEGYFCDFDDKVVILESLDHTNKQMIYQDAIATVQIEDED